MKPFILNFMEKQKESALDFSMIEYCEKQNLSIIKNTNLSAVTFMDMGTMTMTKAQMEGTDSDTDNKKWQSTLNACKEASSFVYCSDITFSKKLQMLKLLLDTTTITESVEGTDVD